MATRGVYRGGEGMRTYLSDVGKTWRQFDVTVGAVEEVAGHVLVTGRVYARARATSLVADDPVAFAWPVVDGRVAWGRVFTSEAAAREAAQAGTEACNPLDARCFGGCEGGTPRQEESPGTWGAGSPGRRRADLGSTTKARSYNPCLLPC